MTLIAGRSSKQGTSLNNGKLNEAYQRITSTLAMNEKDMARLGINEGDKLRISNEVGDTIVTCAKKKAADLPDGMIFIPYGPHSSELMGSDTAGSGMPLSKVFTVKVEKAEG